MRKPNFDARENKTMIDLMAEIERMIDLMTEIIKDQEINKQILKHGKKSNV